ncbi:MAG: PrgI family protein [Candidatus Saccharimonadales bacterium]
MATYKVLQDIEAEDKLLGPLSLKQFIFAAMTIGMGVAIFFIGASPAPIFLKTPLILGLLFPMLLTGFLAAPFGHDQPNEIWLLARISFMFRPRKRIWNQDGAKELVTITVPKQEAHVYTNGLTQSEVRSRLSALANTVDSRGWAIKNINANLFAQPGYLGGAVSDRLIDPMSLPQDVPAADITASDDMLDIANNSTAAHLDQLVQESTAAHRQSAIAAMSPGTQASNKPADYWFMNQAAPAPQMPIPSDYAVFQNQQVVAPGTEDIHPAAEATPEEAALAEKLKEDHEEKRSHIKDHMHVVQPLHDRDGRTIAPAQPEPKLDDVDPYQALSGGPGDDQGFQLAEPPLPPTPPLPPAQQAVNPAILGLAANDDLNVATIARQAKRISEDDGEVVISLH